MDRTKEAVSARIDWILEAGKAAAKTSSGESRIDCITFASSYVEPGCCDPESGVIAFGNWNAITKYDKQSRKSDVIDDSPNRVGSLLQKLGVELEWSDEWSTCSDCGGAFRTSADSHCWTRHYVETDGEFICADCILKDPSDYLRSLEGEHDKAITFDIDFSKWGYRKLAGDYEHGFHPGQDASPKLIADALRKQGIERFLFNIDSVGQFDLSFSVYVHEDEFEKVDQEEFASADTDGPSVSEGLKRALQAAAKIPQSPDGITVVKCDASTGTATSKVVSPEDFANGKALDDPGFTPVAPHAEPAKDSSASPVDPEFADDWDDDPDGGFSAEDLTY